MKEAVTNVVKHSKATSCTVTIMQQENELQLTIKDNGLGFKESFIQAGNGLKGMRERVGFINGTIDIASDDGTEVCIRVPVTITHQKGSDEQ